MSKLVFSYAYVVPIVLLSQGFYQKGAILFAPIHDRYIVTLWRSLDPFNWGMGVTCYLTTDIYFFAQLHGQVVIHHVGNFWLR